MATAQQITNGNQRLNTPAIAPLKPIPQLVSPGRSGNANKQGQILPVTVELNEVMFTGRVPISAWTFAIGIQDKLWISRLTTLSFGKRHNVNSRVFRNRMFIPDYSLDLDLDITAYNQYGDVLKAKRPLRAYIQNTHNQASRLIRLEEDWTQLLLNFKVNVG